MPGYVIHLAVGNCYIGKNNIHNKESFLKGCIAPDLLQKITSHYKKENGEIDLKRFLAEKPLDSDYNKGYFLHLVTDYLFYNKYLKQFSNVIYHDYNKLNEFLIDKYNIEIPPEIIEFIGYENGEPEVLDKDSMCRFIEAVSSIDLERCRSLNRYLQEYSINQEKTER